MSKMKNNRWLPTAMIAPLIQASSNCSWVAALAIGLLCLIIQCGMEKLEVNSEKTRILSAIQWLWMLLIVSEFLHWIMLYWPESTNYHAAPLIVLALAAYTVKKNGQHASAIAGVLFWILIVMLGAVLLSGIKQIKPINLKPVWKMQTAYYVVVLLIPVMISEISAKWKLPASGAVVAMITGGVMSLDLMEKMNAPFYEMSKTLTLFGIGQRYESLVASGMTMGYYVLMTLLLQISVDAWGQEKHKNTGLWISTVFAGMVFLSGMRMNSRLLAGGTLCIWVIFPVFEKITKKMKKPLDK